MAKVELISAARLREILFYNPETGIVTWRIAHGRCRRIPAGGIAGYPDKGYLGIELGDGRNYRLHRLIWLLQKGDWPVSQIDHINGNGLDNRWVNLRQATGSQNQHNARLRKDSTSGLKGVSWVKPRRKWAANIRINGKNVRLGLFNNKVHAALAYHQAALKYHGEFARLS